MRVASIECGSLIAEVEAAVAPEISDENFTSFMEQTVAAGEVNMTVEVAGINTTAVAMAASVYTGSGFSSGSSGGDGSGGTSVGVAVGVGAVGLIVVVVGVAMVQRSRRRLSNKAVMSQTAENTDEPWSIRRTSMGHTETGMLELNNSFVQLADDPQSIRLRSVRRVNPLIEFANEYDDAVHGAGADGEMPLAAAEYLRHEGASRDGGGTTAPIVPVEVTENPAFEAQAGTNNSLPSGIPTELAKRLSVSADGRLSLLLDNADEMDAAHVKSGLSRSDSYGDALNETSAASC